MIYQKYRIDEVCDLVKGTYKTMKTEPGDYPLVVTAEFRRRASTYQLEGPAVCVPLISSTGHGHAALHRVHYQEGKFALANLLVGLLPKDETVCNPKYLYYLLNAKKDRYFVPLMQGTANVSLKIPDIAAVEIALPPFEEQKRIVGEIESLAAKVDEMDRYQKDIQDEYPQLVESLIRRLRDKYRSETDYTPLSEIVDVERRPVNLEPDEEYREIGIYSYGRGIFHKPPRTGFEVGNKKIYRVKENDLVFQITFAWEGAIAVASQQDDGMCGSVRFPTFRVKEDICNTRYLLTYLLTKEGISQIGKISPGSAGRNRVLSLKRFKEILVPVLPLIIQKKIVNNVFTKIDELKKLRAEKQRELTELVPSILDKAFKGEL